MFIIQKLVLMSNNKTYIIICHMAETKYNIIFDMNNFVFNIPASNFLFSA